MQIEDTLYGQQHIAVTGFREGTNVATISQFFMPSFTGSGISGPNVYASNLRIPIDDESCFHYRLRWSYEPFSQQQVWEDKYGGYTYPEQVPGTFLAKENKDNDYLVDRLAQKNYSFTGIKAFPIQDLALVEDQWGARADRSLERLVTADQNIIAVRRRLITAARALMEGEEPSGPSNPDAYRVHTVRMTLPDTLSIEETVEAVKSKNSGPVPVAITSN